MFSFQASVLFLRHLLVCSTRAIECFVNISEMSAEFTSINGNTLLVGTYIFLTNRKVCLYKVGKNVFPGGYLKDFKEQT